MMNRISSIFEEISNTVPEKSKLDYINMRGMNVISSVNNLMAFIDETLDEDDAEFIKRRIMISIKNGNDKKFKTGIQRLKSENKDENS